MNESDPRVSMMCEHDHAFSEASMLELFHRHKYPYARTAIWGKSMCLRFLKCVVVVVLALLSVAQANAEIPKSTPPGSFPNPKGYRAKYSLGWAGIPAATAEALLVAQGDRLTLSGKASTIGPARVLWKLDASLESIVEADSLRPIRSELIEEYSRVKSVITHTFDRSGVFYRKIETPEPERPAKPRYIENPDVLDLFGALLRFRSQPLANGEKVTAVETQGNTLYVSVLTVESRETIRTAGREWPAIRCSLGLQRVGKTGLLEPHRKFRRASTWLSDDADRYVLRIESDVFVGFVYAELTKVEKLP
jgi:hypothetical protein